MTPLVPLRRALADPNLLGTAMAGDSWLPWRSMLLAIMGEPLEPDELAIFRLLTGRDVPPSERVEECAIVAGRRGGKTRAMAALAVYIAGLCEHRGELARGERGVVLLIAPDMRQARVALDYAEGILDSTPILRQLVATRSPEAVSLTTGVDIQVRAASFRRLRGLTAVAVFADEACFWHSDESANPDTEIIGAARPTLATTGGPLVMISSPYARRGEVFNVWRQHHGPAGDPGILVAQGGSRDFNPSLPQSVVDRAMARDPAAARAEYLGLWREDVESFVSREAVEACVSSGVLERPPIPGRSYFGFVDPSGGSSDSMTLAVAHMEKGLAVLDAVRERRPPFSPDAVVTDFAEALQSYGLRRVVGDRYAGEWPREAFRSKGISYDLSSRAKSDIYRDALPALNSRGFDLLDTPRLLTQLCALERRTSRGGRDSIDHGPGAHDDLANAAAGALLSALDSVRTSFSGCQPISDGSTYSIPGARLGFDPRTTPHVRIGDRLIRAIPSPNDLN